jgi:shikimate kinase
MASSARSAEHVVLVGMMGSGKTTVGRALARRLHRPFVDSDAKVEGRTGRTVREIFEAEGEPAFRRHERVALLDAVASPVPAVIAAAGGVVLDPANRVSLRSAGTVVWLRAPVAVLGRRVASGDHRPLLRDDPEAVLARLGLEREPLYLEVADHVIDVDDLPPDEGVERVVSALGVPQEPAR